MIGMNAKLWGAAALIAGAPLFAETPAEQPPSSPSSGSGQEEPQGEMAGNLLSGTLKSSASWKSSCTRTICT